jgi:hypothetical protein
MVEKERRIPREEPLFRELERLLREKERRIPKDARRLVKMERLIVKNARLIGENAPLFVKDAPLLGENALLFVKDARLLGENAPLPRENARLVSESGRKSLLFRLLERRPRRQGLEGKAPGAPSMLDAGAYAAAIARNGWVMSSAELSCWTYRSA